MTIKLPEPDTHCLDDDVQPPRDVWSYSADLVRQIIEADRAQRGEPVAWMWQHEETGRTGFIEANLAKDWEKLNPRLPLVCPVFTAPQPERKHTEAEVQEIISLSPDYQYYDKVLEANVRRILGVPKP